MATELNARLAARIRPDIYDLIKRAAEIEGVTLTHFIISNLQSAARKVIAEAEVIELSLKDQHQFANALLNEYEPNDEMKKAMADYARLFENQ